MEYELSSDRELSNYSVSSLWAEVAELRRKLHELKIENEKLKARLVSPKALDTRYEF